MYFSYTVLFIYSSFHTAVLSHFLLHYIILQRKVFTDAIGVNTNQHDAYKLPKTP